MKKFSLILALFSLFALACGCSRTPDFLDYISEKRYNIYLYSDDLFEIKINASERESPYSVDGIKGDMSPFFEVFVTLDKNYDEVNISVGNISGQMNYRAVENCYYLSSSNGGIEGDKTEVTLTLDGEIKTYSVPAMLYEGVISCEQAAQCVIEHDRELFSSLTRKNFFEGEIFVRLLYDEGCYYYVGVCDRNKKINAYLVDGVRGTILATKP